MTSESLTLRRHQRSDEAASASCAGLHAAAIARLGRFGRKGFSLRRDASRSKSFSPQSGQTSSPKPAIVALLFWTMAVSVTVCLRSRLLPLNTLRFAKDTRNGKDLGGREWQIGHRVRGGLRSLCILRSSLQMPCSPLTGTAFRDSMPVVERGCGQSDGRGGTGR